MTSLRYLMRLNVFRVFFRSRAVLLIGFAVSLCLIYTYNKSHDKTPQSFISVSKLKTFVINTSLFTSIEDVSKALARSNGFLAATRRNSGKMSSHSSVCVVDPAVSDCTNLGFAAFLLVTLDYIMLCRALGSDQPVVFWRGCFSVCSRDRAVNSWNWYFEPVNPGLELQVERVLCPLLITNISDVFAFDPELSPILDNSFKNRSELQGFEDSRIITTEERTRINKLMKKYVKPNSRITEKVETFYDQYLAGFTVLGVHVRGTDHWIETVRKRLPPLMDWVKNAQTVLEILPRPRKIFIASDNNEIIKTFLAFFGKETVVYTKAVRARRYHSEVAPHFFEFEDNPADPYERAVGTQVLTDILLLAKCDRFLHAESSVASLASYFNPHMKSYFMDGTLLKEKEQVPQRRIPNTETNATQEASEEQQELKEEDVETDDVELECFLKNYATSTCLDSAKGLQYVDKEGARRLLKRH